MMEYDTENMNSEEIYSSLRGVTEAIKSFSCRSQEDLNEPVRPEGKRDDAVSHVASPLTDTAAAKSASASCFTVTLMFLPRFVSYRQVEKAWRRPPAATPAWA